MNDLQELLTREADRVTPKPNVLDVYLRANQRRRNAKKRAVALSAVSVLLVGSGLMAARTAGRVRTVAPAQAEETEATLGGLVINGSAGQSYRASTLDRVDNDPDHASQSVVVRASDGSIAARTAVITFRPNLAPDSTGGYLVRSFDGVYTRHLAGGAIIVRSVALADFEAMALAHAAQMVDGRLVVAIPPALPNFSVIASGSWRPDSAREARYGCADLGEVETQGLCYAGLTFSPGFQDALIQAGFTPGPLVQGHPSVVSTVGGGSATLAWEPRPGVIAYIGYSANPNAADTTDDMARLAERARFLSPDEWTATEPQVISQSNQWVQGEGLPDSLLAPFEHQTRLAGFDPTMVVAPDRSVECGSRISQAVTIAVTTTSATPSAALQQFLDSPGSQASYIPLPTHGFNEYHLTSDDTFRYEAYAEWTTHGSITVSPVGNKWAVTNWTTGYC